MAVDLARSEAPTDTVSDRLLSRALLAGLLVSLSAAPAAALTVTLLTGAGRSLAGNGVPPPDDAQVVAFASPPFAAGPITAMDGGGSSSTTYTFTNAALLFEFAHTRPGNPTGVYVWSDDFVPGSGVTFSVSEPVVALLSGAYQVADTGSGDNVWYDVRLYGNGFSTLLHETYNSSVATPNESFVVGQAGGDHENIVTGDTVHVLVPGVPYALDWYVGIQDGHLDPGDTGASATGSYRIDFLPEPSSPLMLVAGVATLVALARRMAR
jgi:hypothetical protein